MHEPLEKIPEQSNTKSIWIKGLYLLFFLLIGYLVGVITFFIVIVQFIFNAILKKPNEQLQDFGQSLGMYFHDIILFVTYNSDEMPFPFKKWPARTRTKH